MTAVIARPSNLRLALITAVAIASTLVMAECEPPRPLPDTWGQAPTTTRSPMNKAAKEAIARDQALARENRLTKAEQQAKARAIIEADQAAHAHENDPRWY